MDFYPVLDTGYSCCYNCSKLYFSSIDTSTLKISSLTNEDATQICCICLGILSHSTTKEFFDQLVDEVCKQHYDSKTFFLALSFPVSVLIRIKALEIMIIKHNRHFPLLTMKDAWRHIFSSYSDWVIDESNTSLEISIIFNHQNDSSNLFSKCNTTLLQKYGLTKRRRGDDNSFFSRTIITKLLNDISADDFEHIFDDPLQPLNTSCTYEISMNHFSVFLGGRYCKFSRQLSQTPWIINGTRRYETSVEELIAKPVQEFFASKSWKFLSSGREDVDVMTFGSGRPFALEVIDPHQTLCNGNQLINLQNIINSSSSLISVNSLKIVSKKELEVLKNTDEDIQKTKSYSALCLCPDLDFATLREKFDKIKSLTIHQKTPIRVMHRRTIITRERKIHALDLLETYEKEKLFKIGLETEAGTYVKEFVHGDFGRTEPNLGSLLGHPCEILQLTVTEVNVKWP